MMRRAARWFLLSSVALASTAGGCGRADRSTGSQTNWLTHCEGDADCAVGECWCHVCSTPCAAEGECKNGRCRATTDLGCAEASTSPLLCVVECSSLADCRGRGLDVECENGACLPATAGAAGAGTGGSGGGGNAGDGATAGASAAGGNTAAGAGGATSGAGNATAGEAGQGGDGPEVGGPTEARVAIGHTHSCLVSGGKLYCWGMNQYGEVGATPDANSAFGPHAIIEVPHVGDVASVAVSGNHSCALTKSGEVYCWGSNDANQVGSESAPPLTCSFEMSTDYPCQPTPTLVPGVDHAVELDVDVRVSCAVIYDGTVRCWGDTSDLGSWLSTLTSVKSFSVGSPISTGPLVACATLADGTLTCNFDLPAEIGTWGPTGTLELRHGGDSSGVTGFGCALGTDGGVTCFGDGGFGQLGNDAGASERALAGGATALAMGAAHACALLSDGTVTCWGSNDLGAVGGYPLASPDCGTSPCESVPRVVEGLPPLVAIGASDDQTCGLAADETLWCWGRGASNFGAPVRLLGPWEENGEACSEILGQAGGWRYSTNQQCTTDEDCVAIPLDLPCQHTCDMAPVEKQYAPDYEATLDELRSSVCAEAAAAGCASPALTCPERLLRVVCNTGTCTLDDPERTGCTDHCACAIERRRTTQTSVCDGVHLSVVDFESCGQCEGSFVYLVIANRGASGFQGEALLDFTARDLGAPLVPEDRTLTLRLGPGETTDPIRIDSASKGYVDVNIVADGDCQPGSIDFARDFPSPTHECP